MIWLKEGDKNNKYFHKIANSHRCHNSICQLFINGEISSDQDVIKAQIIGFYQHLFTEDTDCRPLQDGLACNSISTEEATWLERSFEEEDIFNVVCNMNGDKSPGPKSFPTEFFHAC